MLRQIQIQDPKYSESVIKSSRLVLVQNPPHSQIFHEYPSTTSWDILLTTDRQTGRQRWSLSLPKFADGCDWAVIIVIYHDTIHKPVAGHFQPQWDYKLYYVIYISIYRYIVSISIYRIVSAASISIFSRFIVVSNFCSWRSILPSDAFNTGNNKKVSYELATGVKINELSI